MNCATFYQCRWCGTRFSRRRHWLKHGKGFRCLRAQLMRAKRNGSAVPPRHAESFGTRTRRIER